MCTESETAAFMNANPSSKNVASTKENERKKKNELRVLFIACSRASSSTAAEVPPSQCIATSTELNCEFNNINIYAYAYALHCIALIRV